jgi:hypothetical protein
MNPPSSPTSWTEIPSRSSSAAVPGSSAFSTRLPSALDAGRISLRAPGLVLSVTSAGRLTNPNSVGLRASLADRPGVRVVERDDPVGDRLAGDTLAGLRSDLLAPIGHLLQRCGGLKLRLRPAPARPAADDRRNPARLLDRARRDSPVRA